MKSNQEARLDNHEFREKNKQFSYNLWGKNEMGVKINSFKYIFYF